jgi:peptidyl-tRNA hydrolase
MKIKQYIVLRQEIPPSVATIGVAHGVLGAYLKWKDEPIVQQWVSGIFYKVICQARNHEEFEAIKKWPDGLQITESSLNGLTIAVVFKPFEWSKSSIFNDLKLYG